MLFALVLAMIACPPISQPMPSMKLVSPADGESNVAKNAVKVLLASDAANTVKSYPWAWIRVELIPPAGQVLDSGPAVLDDAATSIYNRQSATTYRYSVASFNFGNVPANTNSRILVDVVVPEGRGCPSVHHKGIVGSFTSAV